MTVTIPLGDAERVGQLYSWPNVPHSDESLADTVTHWFSLTLERDGLAAAGATASCRTDAAETYVLDLDGPPALAAQLSGYQARLPAFLDLGWQALTTVIPKIKAAGAWDPSPDPEPPPYRPWRFFLPHGMTLLNQKSVQFFHYPPIRLLEGTQDYLQDPVPVRCAELLSANGVADADLPFFNRVLDATPIAAEDDQGSKKGGDKEWGLIPIQSFHDYQRALLGLLLTSPPGVDGYTYPVVVYGAHPRATFEQLYDVKLGVNRATTAEITPGRKTPVLGANHPYMFYAAAQGTVGSGHFQSASACARAVTVMQGDLVACRWQKLMSDDPSQDPVAMVEECTKYWQDPARAGEICALARHQASLYYASPTSLQFTFNTSLDVAAKFCAANGNQACAGVG